MNYIVYADKITNSSDVSPIAVASLAVVYTKAMKISHAVSFALQIQLASSGSPDVKVEIEESTVLPTTEGAADGNYVVADGASAVYADLTDKLVHIKSITPAVAQYMRLKLTGMNANPADTTVAAKLITQQPT